MLHMECQVALNKEDSSSSDSSESDQESCVSQTEQVLYSKTKKKSASALGFSQQSEDLYYPQQYL